MLAGQVEEGLLALEKHSRDDIVRVLLVSFLLEVREEAPTEETRIELVIGATEVAVEFLDKLAVLGGVALNDELVGVEIQERVFFVFGRLIIWKRVGVHGA